MFCSIPPLKDNFPPPSPDPLHQPLLRPRRGYQHRRRGQLQRLRPHVLDENLQEAVRLSVACVVGRAGRTSG